MVRVDTAQSKRIITEAKERGLYLDWTTRKKTKSLILFDNGHVAGSFLSVATVLKRLNESCAYDVSADKKLLDED